jgi:hypothetical protein
MTWDRPSSSVGRRLTLRWPTPSRRRRTRRCCARSCLRTRTSRRPRPHVAGRPPPPLRAPLPVPRRLPRVPRHDRPAPRLRRASRALARAARLSGSAGRRGATLPPRRRADALPGIPEEAPDTAGRVSSTGGARHRIVIAQWAAAPPPPARRGGFWPPLDHAMRAHDTLCPPSAICQAHAHLGLIKGDVVNGAGLLLGLTQRKQAIVLARQCALANGCTHVSNSCCAALEVASQRRAALLQVRERTAQHCSWAPTLPSALTPHIRRTGSPRPHDVIWSHGNFIVVTDSLRAQAQSGTRRLPCQPLAGLSRTQCRHGPSAALAGHTGLIGLLGNRQEVRGGHAEPRLRKR